MIRFEWYLDDQLVATGEDYPVDRLQLKVIYERDVLPKPRRKHDRTRAARTGNRPSKHDRR